MTGAVLVAQYCRDKCNLQSAPPVFTILVWLLACHPRKTQPNNLLNEQHGRVYHIHDAEEEEEQQQQQLFLCFYYPTVHAVQARVQLYMQDIVLQLFLNLRTIRDDMLSIYIYTECITILYEYTLYRKSRETSGMYC
jgi:hypothetical protein